MVISRTLFSKFFNIKSTIAVLGVLLYFAFNTKGWCMEEGAEVKEPYDFRVSLSGSLFESFEDEQMVLIMNKSIEDNKCPLVITSKYFHNLSRVKDITVLITSKEALKEFLGPRRLYVGPYPLHVHLALGLSIQKLGRAIPNLDVPSFGAFLKKYPCLKRLHLSEGSVTEQGAQILGKYLVGNTCLIELNLLGNTLLDEKVKSIFQGIAHNSTLQALSIESMRCSDYGNTKKLVYDAINNHPKLKSITIVDEFSGNMIRDFLNNCSSLTSLHIVEKYALNKQMFSALVNHTSLKKLSLRLMCSEINNEAGISLVDAIRQNASLTHFELEATMASDVEINIKNVCETKNIKYMCRRKEPPKQYYCRSHPMDLRGTRWYQ